MKIAVMGYGTIGSGVVEALSMNQDSISKKVGQPVEVKYVLIFGIFRKIRFRRRLFMMSP